MDVDRWRQIDELFHGAAACDGSERERVLTVGCGDDSALRAEVVSLLTAHEHDTTFIDVPAFDLAPRAVVDAMPSIAAGRRIGAYTIRGILGAGGMGAVYEADQDNPRRPVALKLLRAMPLRDELTVRLFQREAQALARLEHAGIAAIHEAGHTDDGWHYFAMERIAGKPLTEYAQEHNLSVRQRLELFKRVCDAVHYAHQCGVIHRDLKPNNILVTFAGQPKVLDFGLALITDPEAESTRLTEQGAFQGTLVYASPEQASGRVDEIDWRSDVYSLGVILYELLTGQRPYDIAGLPLPEAARVICKLAPKPPGSIDRALRGDLETIVGKALEKEPHRRYASVSQFASDVNCYLRNEPITARPASAFYQFRKLAGRHKLPFSLAIGLFVALGAFAVVSTIQAVRISDQRDQAVSAQQREVVARQQAEKVSDFFLMDLFEVTDPQKAKIEKLTAREVLDKGAQRIREKFDGQPETQATLMFSMGRVYLQLGLNDNARDLLQESLKLREEIHGPEHLEIATVKFYLALVDSAMGDADLCVALLREALDLRQRLAGDDDLSTAQSRLLLGMILASRGVYDEADDLLHAALATYRAKEGDRSADVAHCLTTLEPFYNHCGRHAEAEAASREALEIAQDLYGERHPDVAAALSAIGWTFNYRGEYAQALPYLEQALALYRDLYGEESPAVVRGWYRVGNVLARMERYAEAEEMLQKARLIARTLSSSGDNPELVGILEMLAACLRARFDYDGAQAMLEEMWKVQGRSTSPSDTDGYSWCLASEFQFERPDFEAGDRLSREGYAVLCAISPEENEYRVTGQAYRGWALGRLGRFDEAEPLLRRAVELTRQHTNDGHRCLARGRAILGWLLVERGKYEEAESVLREALPILAKRDDPRVSEGVYDSLGQALTGQGDFDAAKESLSQALEMCVAKYGKEHPSAAGAMLHLAELYHDRGDLNAARPLYEESLSTLQKFLKSSHPSILMARVGLGKLLMDEVELDEAEAELRDALTQQIEVMGENHPHVARTKCLLGVCLARQGSGDDAETLFLDGFERLRDIYPPEHRFVREATGLAEDVPGLAEAAALNTPVVSGNPDS